MSAVSLRQLNRWTLARQLLLERAELDPVSAIERLAGMQAQHSPSPYIGLWSRLRDFGREDLEQALTDDQVLKATLMRGTLHLVPARDFDCYRLASRGPNHIYSQQVRQLLARGVDVEAIRAEIIAAVRQRPLSRTEIRSVGRHLVPEDLPDWTAWSTVALSRDVINLPEPYRKIVIRKNGDVLPTFLVDGLIAGTWEAPLRGRAVLTLTPLDPIAPRDRREAEHEAERLLAWLRPDTDRRDLGWMSA